jgi:hypothetical protein
MQVRGALHAPTALPIANSPGVRYVGGYVGPEVAMDTMTKTRISARAWNRTAIIRSFRPYSNQRTDRAVPGSVGNPHHISLQQKNNLRHLL